MKDGVLVVPTSRGVPMWSREIGSLTQAHDFAVATGSLTISEIKDVIFDNVGSKIFHWCGHGSAKGLVVDDKTLWDVDDFLMTVRAARYEMVFINSCDAERLGNRVAFEAGVPVVVHGANDLYDEAAARVASNMYSLLPRDGRKLIDYYRAYVAARPDGGSVLITIGEETMRQSWSDSDKSRIEKLESQRSMFLVFSTVAISVSVVSLLMAIL